MDELDGKIIKLLQANGRASNARMAREGGVSEGTVRRRLRRLVQDGVIKVIAVPHLERMGFPATALIGLQTDPAAVDDVASALVALHEVHYVAITTGAYDVFAWVALGSSEELGAFLRSTVGTIKGVRRTETFVNLSIRKRTYGMIL